jgi:hypothetical protein
MDRRYLSIIRRPLDVHPDHDGSGNTQPGAAPLMRETFFNRLGSWARMRLSEEHHCAPPVDGLDWSQVAEREAQTSRPAVYQKTYSCPACDQVWAVKLA